MLLSDVSIKHPVFATMMMVALAVLGVASYRELKIDQFPDVDIPVVTVTTVYPGASPETLEREVTKKLEEAINTVEGVRHIQSTSQEGVSTVVVEFQLEIPTDTAAEDVRAKVAALRGELPGDIEEPIVQKIDFSQMPVISVALEAPSLRPQAATELAEELVKRRLETVAGVGAVNLVGESKREIQVVVDRERLEAYRISLAEVVGALRRENLEAPAGAADRGASEALVRVAARGVSAPEIAEIPVKQAGTATLRIRDLARVVDGVREPRNLALLDEQPALALDVQKQAGANTVAVADGVKRALARLAGDLPEGVALRVIRDDSTFVRDSIHDVNTTMVIGALLTVLIVFAFLNSWRSTVITGVTLPISVIAGFAAMKAFGFTINVLTLMGLSLAIGMLIDDAIVVRENIVRHLQRGKDHLAAARDGTAEIGLAVMATTFTIVAVFVPVAFMGGMIGRFFYEFGITVAAAVLASLFVSFTLDPMLSSRWVDPDVDEEHAGRGLHALLHRFNAWFQRRHDDYERGLTWALRHRKSVVGAAALSFALGLGIFGILGSDFMPDFDRGEYQILFRSTPGTTLRETGERAREMVRRLKAVPGVSFTYTTIGESGGAYRPVTEGATYVKLAGGRKRSFHESLAEARTAVADIPGLTFGFVEAGLFQQKPIQVSVRGESLEELDRVSRDLMAAMTSIPGVADVESSLEKSKPELRVELDRARASDLGISAAVVGTTLRAALNGEVATTIEDEDGDAHDVRVRLRADQRRFAPDLLALHVPTREDDAQGDKILRPIGEIAAVAAASGPSTIRRYDLVREVRVSAGASGRSLGEVSADVTAAARSITVPAGYDFVFGGDTEQLEETNRNIGQALFLAVVFIYVILASQFGSFVHPFSIMLSLPLSLVGVSLGLLVTGDTLNIMSQIGLIMLMGLVTKNAILLVDFANHARQRGASRERALVEAGRTRLRPIVMTTLAMIAGMLPLAFAIGAGAEMRAPMARAVIGGLITSTLLTLVVVPVAYTLLEDLGSVLAASRWAGWRRGGGVLPAGASGEGGDQA